MANLAPRKMHGNERQGMKPDGRRFCRKIAFYDAGRWSESGCRGELMGNFNIKNQLSKLSERQHKTYNNSKNRSIRCSKVFNAFGIIS
jgi:hypothetical protein